MDVDYGPGGSRLQAPRAREQKGDCIRAKTLLVPLGTRLFGLFIQP